jgi:hypothetical protein
MSKKIDFKKGKLRDVGTIFDFCRIGILGLSFIALFVIYVLLFGGKIENNRYATSTTKFYNENSATDFQIEQILVYSSAYANDHSDNGNLTDISISQFSDIAIYIDNKKNSNDLSEKNTVNKLYIDNIAVSIAQENPQIKLGYKNFNLFGKYNSILDAEDARIDFTIAHSNTEKNQIATQRIENEEDETTYSNVPTFYTDCSNPITLSYINENLIEHLNYKNKYVPFSGAILNTAKINLDTIKPKISFDIHLFNNYNEEYVRSVYLDLVFKDNKSSIGDGYIIQYNNYENGSLSFLKK